MALRLMCVTAHPDDESGAFGGALLQAHARGVETFVLCLTPGSAGSMRGEAKTDAELAAIRRVEFGQALKVLQVDHGEVLDYPDGGLAKQDFFALTTAVLERIRRFRPHVVLTFGGEGNVNRHVDHTMAGLFTTAAFHWAPLARFETAHPPCSPQKLYYASPAFFAYLNEEEAASVPLTPASLRLHVGDLLEKKLEAFARHKTQAGLLDRVREALNKYGRHERYLLAAAPAATLLADEDDMFAGVRDD